MREGVHRGIPLAAFLRSLRLGHATAWKAILAQLEQRSSDRDQLAAAADLASAWLFAYVDVLSSVAEEIYTQERERWLRTAAAVQTETIAAILEERNVDAGLASRRLHYELEREHVAIVGWYDGAEEGRDTIAALEAVIGDLAGPLSRDRLLVEPLGLLAVAAWVGSQATFDHATLDGLRPTEPRTGSTTGARRAGARHLGFSQQPSPSAARPAHSHARGAPAGNDDALPPGRIECHGDGRHGAGACVCGARTGRAHGFG